VVLLKIKYRSSTHFTDPYSLHIYLVEKRTFFSYFALYILMTETTPVPQSELNPVV